MDLLTQTVADLARQRSREAKMTSLIKELLIRYLLNWLKEHYFLLLQRHIAMVGITILPFVTVVNPVILDDSCQSVAKRKRRKYTKSTDAAEKQQIHLSERQQVLLLKNMNPQNSPKANSPALSGASSNQGTGTTTSGTDNKVFKRNNRGETHLHIAAHRGDTKQILELLELGLDVNALDNADWTPLHEACNKGHVEAAKILIEHGALINAKGDEDVTPLHDAAGSGCVELVRLLLEHGADPNSSDKSGRTPIDCVTDSLTIENELKSWPTYKADKSETVEEPEPKQKGKDKKDETSVSAVEKGKSPPQKVQTPIPAISISPAPSSVDAAPKSTSVSPSISTGSTKLLGDKADESLHLEPRADASEDAMHPPLLTPQLPHSPVKEESREVTETVTPEPSLPPPALEPAVTNLQSMEPLTSPPLVVITEQEQSEESSDKISAGTTSELLLKVVSTEEKEPALPEKVEEKSVEESIPQDDLDDQQDKTAGKLEPTVASYRSRRKNLSKEAPGSTSSEGNKGYRKRLASLGGNSPLQKESSASPSLEKGSAAKKRLITRSDDDSHSSIISEKKDKKDKKGKSSASETTDPYEFSEEALDVTETTATNVIGSTPTSSPKSAAASPFKNNNKDQPSPAGRPGRPRGGKNRQSSPASNSEQKLPPLKIKINRPGNPSTEVSRHSGSDSSASSVKDVKNETEEADESSQNTIDEQIKDEQAEQEMSSSNVPPRKRRIRSSGHPQSPTLLTTATNATGSGGGPAVSPSQLPNQEQLANFFSVERPRLPNYILQWQLAKRLVCEKRKQQLAPVQLASVPRGVGDFLMMRKSYLLAPDVGQVANVNANQETSQTPPNTLQISSGGNSPSQQQLSPTLPPSLHALFRSQDEERQRLRTRHRIEQEKLVLSYEQEVLRAYVHREMTAAQAQPLSACAIIAEKEQASRVPIENLLMNSNGTSVVLSQAPENSTSAHQRAQRITARNQRPRLDDLDEKYSRLADNLLTRQRHEAAAMKAVQTSEWNWRFDIVNAMSDSTLTYNESTAVPKVVVPESLPIPRLI